MMELVINQNEIHTAIYNWIFNGSNGISDLYIIGAQYDQDGQVVLDSNSVTYTPQDIGKSTLVKKYLGGVERVKYDFGLKQYAPITTQSNTPANLRVTNAFEQLVLWIKNEYESENYKQSLVFPEGCTIEKIEVSPGTIAGADKNGVEFIIIISVIYTKRRKK